MSAVVECQVPARRNTASRAAIQATAVEPIADRGQLGQCRGLHLLQTHCSLFGQFIAAHDVIEVDFDRRSIKGDAEYLIAFRHTDDYSWYGVRRFQFRLDGELWIADPTIHGEGQTWRIVTPEMLANIEVFGMVREVYKPLSKLRR